MIVVRLLLSFFSVFTWAQEAPSSAAPKGIQEKMRGLQDRALVVVWDDRKGAFHVKIKEQSFVDQTPMLFFRIQRSRLEIIAFGKVESEIPTPAERGGKGKELVIRLDVDTLVKYPVSGDLVVPLSDANDYGLGEKKQSVDFLRVDDPEPEDLKRDGFLDFGMGLLNGSLDSTTSTRANRSKNVQTYRFQLMELRYFSDFIPVGFEYHTHSGIFPTRDYYLQQGETKSQVSVMRFWFQTPRFFKNFQAWVGIAQLNDQFTTSNLDENLLTTQLSGMGYAARLQYVNAAERFVPKRERFMAYLQRVYVDYTMFSGLSVNDQGVSRGASSTGSTGSLLRAGAQLQFYLPFVPLIKRWWVEVGYESRQYQLKFSGATVSEVGNPYVIPEGTTGKEKENFFKVSAGFRFDDPFGFMISEKKAKKP